MNKTALLQEAFQMRMPLDGEPFWVSYDLQWTSVKGLPAKSGRVEWTDNSNGRFPRHTPVS